MRPYELADFNESPAWCMVQLDTVVGKDQIDIYVLVDLPSGLIIAQEFITTSLGPSPAHVRSLLNQASVAIRKTPSRLLISKSDPFLDVFREEGLKVGLKLEETPASYLENILEPLKNSFAENFPSYATIPDSHFEDWADADDKEAARSFIPDTYSACPCASGKKFKFCCKPGFNDIMLAMAAAQSGYTQEALKHIAKAKQTLGETAEVLCREAVVFSFTDLKKSNEIQVRALKVDPKHPRANYIRGLTLKNAGAFDEAILAYQTAIENYPKSDRYHLNETYNNLGSAFFEKGEFIKAKSAWEQALALLPADKVVRQNLREFIYGNLELPNSVREISPYIERFLNRTKRN